LLTPCKQRKSGFGRAKNGVCSVVSQLLVRTVQQQR
jgi:hypothetical protein